MELFVYNGEIFERGIVWRIIMGTLFILLVFVTLFSARILGDTISWLPDWTDVLSTLLIIALFWGYWFYVRKEIEKKILVRIIPNEGLWIGDKFYQRHAVQGFSLEMQRKTEDLHNIIFLVNQGYEIYTLDKESENIEGFIRELSEYTLFVEKFHQGWFNKFLRRIKI